MEFLLYRCDSDGPGSTPGSASQPEVRRRQLLRASPSDVAMPFSSGSLCWPLLAASCATSVVAGCSPRHGASHHRCERDVAVRVPAAEPPEHSWGTCDASPG